MSRLEDIKGRISVPLPELEVRVTDNLRWADVTPKGEPDGATHRVARCADDEHAELFAHAPADLAVLVAVVEAVQAQIEDLYETAERLNPSDPLTAAGLRAKARNFSAAIQAVTE